MQLLLQRVLVSSAKGGSELLPPRTLLKKRPMKICHSARARAPGSWVALALEGPWGLFTGMRKCVERLTFPVKQPHT